MATTFDLWLYFAVVLGIVALPGLDMAFVLGCAMIGGRRAGLAAVAGIVAGGACHVLMAALGVAALLHVWPALYPLLLVGGSAYMAWIAVALLRGATGFALGATSGGLSAATAFRRAMLTNLMNPKAYVFMLAVFPQFLHAERGPVWLQSGVLGAITALTQMGVYGALALAAARAAHWFGEEGGTAAWTARGLGVLLLATSALGLWQAWLRV
jgi:threonine/homoserine/homoserine lactone efflux protein